ncbi:hypothetical protein Cgig2_004461 [Carnegiea gigantea]|uniref:Retrovirus-related Pol polyprotein from transposon TNT 1-94-like beta-barrel domain-containing protein n=1 Tax=Carnegiea gigantea TaxID=171969 RepID=A0A9Q1Q7K4_9CARY|nr:hypothetical protein Cgig2_023593 [Carnegiea gigantea]KAJ8431429.1 hypothetical protein Cgig2_004461 [Carnegiea gigantea]
MAVPSHNNGDSGPVATPRPSVKWLVSTGVPMHMTPTESVLQNKRVLPAPISLRQVYGSIISGSLVGDVTISHRITLKDVVYIPDLRESFLSVGSLMNQIPNVGVVFDSAGCTFTDFATGETLAIAHPDERGLCLLDMVDFQSHYSEALPMTMSNVLAPCYDG